MHKFCTGEGNAHPIRGCNQPGMKFFNSDVFRKNLLNYAKLIVEPYFCYNLNQVYQFYFIYNKKNNNNSSGRQ